MTAFARKVDFAAADVCDDGNHAAAREASKNDEN